MARAAAEEKAGSASSKVWLEGDYEEDLNAFFSRAASALLDGLRRECQRMLNEHRDRMRAHYDGAVKQAKARAKESATEFIEGLRAPKGSVVDVGLPGAVCNDDSGGPTVLPDGAADALRLDQLLQEARQRSRPALDQGVVPFSAVTCKALHDCMESCRALRKYCEQVAQNLKVEVVAETLGGQEYRVTVRPAADHVHVLIGKLREEHKLPKHMSLFTQAGIKLRSHDELKDYDLESPLILTFEAMQVPRR